MKKGILVYNPISHGGKLATKAIAIAQKKYHENGIELLLHAIDPLKNGFGNLAELIQSQNPDHIIISGGDGTLSKYLDFASSNNIKLPLGIIPTGTANDFAGSASITSDIESAVDIIINGKKILCDTAMVNSARMINVFSSGYLTCVSHTTPDRIKKIFGRLAYFICGVKEVLHPVLRKIKVECDGKIFEGKMLLILVLNGKSAGKMIFADDADISDGMLDVRIFTGNSIAGTLYAAIKVLLGKGLKNSRDVICMKGEKIRIESENHMTDIDGDPGPDYPVEITCQKSSIEVIGKLS